VLPSLFGWKSAKFLTRLQFSKTYRNGFWERLACHERGRISFDERWAEGRGSAIWPWLISLHSMWSGCGLYFFMMNVGATILSALVRIRLIKSK